MPAPPALLPSAIPDNVSKTVNNEGTVLKAGFDTKASSPKLPQWSVEGALESFSLAPPSAPPTSPIPFLHLLERLKTTPREGWRRFSIAPGESISDHMYRMAIITMLAPPALASKLDLPRCTKMALIHDMGESLVGDITPADGISKVEKNRREALSMDFLLGTLLRNTTAREVAGELREIWEEYERSETLEAKFVHDVDKLELVLQMVEYERRYEGRIDLGEFVWVAGRIELREMKELAAELIAEREALWESHGKGGQEKNWDMGKRLGEMLKVSEVVEAVNRVHNSAPNSA